MAQTKDQRIEKLKNQVKDMAGTAEHWRKKYEAVDDKADQLQAELDAGTGMNDRLNKTLSKEREKITDLKGVARFYRAQRDRVDAYLSATLDGIRRQDDRTYGQKETYDRVTSAVEVQAPGPEDRRPRINEPLVRDNELDGRDFSPYRDAEPSRNWEDF